MAYISFQPSDHFNCVLYTGNSSTNAITGVDFQPDLVWTKNRGSSGSHMLYDAIRGALYRLSADTTESNASYAGGLTSFDSDGFTLGNWGGVNSNSNTFVSWNWKANGAGSANTDGSINTTATSVNTTAGFSICKWTGNSSNATIGHGLGVVPQTIFVKNLADAESWSVYHHSIGNTHSLFLDTDGGDSSNSKYWNNTSPTSTTFSVGNGGEVNGSGDAMIAYCFTEKVGFSKFGTYNGTGNADGSFIYTGFEPSLIMIKRSDATAQWQMRDDQRGVNGAIKTLYTDSAEAETSGDTFDILSNGFKIRNDSTAHNGGGNKYLYWAWAKNPIVASNGDVGTAR